MNLKLFKRYLELCKETGKEPNWKDLNIFRSIFA